MGILARVILGAGSNQPESLKRVRKPVLLRALLPLSLALAEPKARMGWVTHLDLLIHFLI